LVPWPFLGQQLRDRVGDERNRDAGQQQGCATTPVAGRPTLEITKSVSKADAQIGDVLDYAVVVRNTGTANLANAIVVDTPPGLRLRGTHRAGWRCGHRRSCRAPGPRLTLPSAR
jgi:uncharacterized repeat protein (TIGR01451 family)